VGRTEELMKGCRMSPKLLMKFLKSISDWMAEGRMICQGESIYYHVGQTILAHAWTNIGEISEEQELLVLLRKLLYDTVEQIRAQRLKTCEDQEFKNSAHHLLSFSSTLLKNNFVAAAVYK